jgi:hypothetical protein
MTETMIYNNADRNSPCWIKVITSREKAEKVVNEPRKPIIRNPLSSALGDQVTAKAPNNKPITQEPTTFTINVE